MSKLEALVTLHSLVIKPNNDGVTMSVAEFILPSGVDVDFLRHCKKLQDKPQPNEYGKFALVIEQRDGSRRTIRVTSKGAKASKTFHVAAVVEKYFDRYDRLEHLFEFEGEIYLVAEHIVEQQQKLLDREADADHEGLN